MVSDHKILLVDDEPAMLASSRELLESAQYDVDTAAQGSDGKAAGGEI